MDGERVKLNELNEIDYIMVWSEFHDEFRERANDDIEDRINEYVRFVSDLKNLSITQHNKIKETIKKIGDRIYEALNKVDENFSLWFDYYVEVEENENGVAYEDDVKFLMVVFFKNNYLDFVANVFLTLKWLLRVYNDQPPPKEEYKPDLETLLDDYLNIYIEKLCENYVKEHEIEI